MSQSPRKGAVAGLQAVRTSAGMLGRLRIGAVRPGGVPELPEDTDGALELRAAPAEGADGRAGVEEPEPLGAEALLELGEALEDHRRGSDGPVGGNGPTG